MSEEGVLNTAITEIVYGKKELKKLTLYPLSIGDQLKVTSLVSEVIQKLAGAVGNAGGGVNDVAIIIVVLNSIGENLKKILSIVADISEEEASAIIDQLTNEQATDLADIIWTINYEPSLKKGRALFERGRKLFHSTGLPGNSSDATPSTE